MNRLILLAGLMGLGAVSCAVPVTPVAGGASVRFTIRQLPAQGAFGVKVLPGQDRLDHYTYTLKQGVATIQGPTNVAAAASPISRTISNISTGNGYTIEVNAVDSNGDSVTTGAATSSTFDVDGTNVYDAVGDAGHTTPLDTVTTPLALSIDLQDGAWDDGPTVTVADTAAVGDKAGISLLNLLNWRSVGVVAKAVDAGPTDFTITHVGKGATDGTSHWLFSYFADNSGEATVAKPQNVSGSAGGIISTTGINLTFDMTQNPTDTGEDEMTGSRMVTSGSDNVYVLDNAGMNITRANTAATIPLGGPTATDLTVRTESDGNDALYFAADDDQLYSNEGTNGAPFFTSMVDLSGVGGTANIVKMCVDASGSLYWMDTNAIKKFPAGSTLDTDVVTIIAAGVGATELAVDAFGNIYYGTATNLYMASLQDNGTYTNTNAEVGAKVATGALITDLTCDGPGNLYFLDGGNLKMHALGNATTVYDVTGTVGATVNRPAVGFNGTLFYEDGANNLMQL